MSSPARLLVADLNRPDVWRGEELARAEKTVPTGHAALDAELPGGGWPLSSAVELLQDPAGRHAWQLLLPALARLAQDEPGPAVLVGAPFAPFVPSLQAQGLALSRLLRVEADPPAARLWAAEQALRCADVIAVLAWLPQARPAELRRLQVAAQQHGQLLFVFRPLRAIDESSPAQLRLRVDGTARLRVHVLKRRGPPATRPVEVPAHPQRLAALLASRRGRDAVSPSPAKKDRSHVLDRAFTLA